jgi:aspartyl-tRNA(Asn)/glutamyl-tRNA(Gln) amidotransferase subunit C
LYELSILEQSGIGPFDIEAAFLFELGLTMSVDAATVRRIAHLARIAVAEDEVEHLQGELNAILAFVEQLSEVNVDGVEPMTSVTPMEMKERKDEVTDGGMPDDIVRNAPATEGHFFLVPKVVE